MTYREYVEKNYPENVSDRFGGGVNGCPYDYVNVPIYSCAQITCTKCFDLQIPKGAFDKITKKPVYPHTRYDNIIEHLNVDIVAELIRNGEIAILEEAGEKSYYCTACNREKVCAHIPDDELTDEHCHACAVAWLMEEIKEGEKENASCT